MGSSFVRSWRCKTYLPYNPDQQLLLPAALQKWLPDDQLAYSSPTWWTNWICRRSRPATRGKGVAGRPSIPG